MGSGDASWCPLKSLWKSVFARAYPGSSIIQRRHGFSCVRDKAMVKTVSETVLRVRDKPLFGEERSPRAVRCPTTIGRWIGLLCQKWSQLRCRTWKPTDRGKLWPQYSSWCPEWEWLLATVKIGRRSSISRRSPAMKVGGPPNRCWWIGNEGLGPVPLRVLTERVSESWLAGRCGTVLPILSHPFWGRPHLLAESPSYESGSCLAPGCERLWRAWKTVRRNAAGIHGLRWSWEMSQRSKSSLIATSWRQKFVIAVLAAPVSGSCRWAPSSSRKSMPRVGVALSILTQERVSATTLVLPSRCRTSVVNSDIAARCRVCIANQMSEIFAIMATIRLAWTGGLLGNDGSVWPSGTLPVVPCRWHCAGDRQVALDSIVLFVMVWNGSCRRLAVARLLVPVAPGHRPWQNLRYLSQGLMAHPVWSSTRLWPEPVSPWFSGKRQCELVSIQQPLRERLCQSLSWR